MVRTKVTRLAMKRGQNSADSKLFIEMKLRDFDVISECHMTNIELKYQNDMDKLNRAFEVLRSRIPKNLLSLTMGELRAMNTGKDELNSSAPLNQTVSANMSALLEKSCRKKSKDDGYLTEESEHGDAFRVGTLVSTSKARFGPLMSAKIRRRSKSAGAFTTPHVSRTLFTAQSAAVSRIQPPASILKQPAPTTERASRAKQKISLTNARPKAVSVDRGYGLIAPKVQPSTPLALLRHARLGETVFSVTGSPVVTSNMLEASANVNIPVANGMLSIRPTEMEAIDANLLEQIDPNVLMELKQLQSNLDKIMSSLNL
ncbi:borealin-like [Anopheles ziemanni]|uniref:borealin-like n=1 Tax=Anopheles ziemanni TaxID=345580 RepID=UPI0026594F98|nr:borealin-like isoform X1 [Anopheles coustani]XP_058172660.1 borealin-like [Anopheles ziemanni]